eukprot:TRINITY_DN5123_c0_g1_i4.p1 TRINITY_DN5123_c0_g1~~TRINITY_DN5123_c0_g1_i4.p1  ORF type:complete len:137 (+),score=4.03 TRINITY_DN5123_c0_g1_i4:361-771(+)
MLLRALPLCKADFGAHENSQSHLPTLQLRFLNARRASSSRFLIRAHQLAGILDSQNCWQLQPATTHVHITLPGSGQCTLTFDCNDANTKSTSPKQCTKRSTWLEGEGEALVVRAPAGCAGADDVQLKLQGQEKVFR